MPCSAGKGRAREVGADRNVKSPGAVQRGLAGRMGDVVLSRGSGEIRHNDGHGMASESHDGFPDGKSNAEPILTMRLICNAD